MNRHERRRWIRRAAPMVALAGLAALAGATAVTSAQDVTFHARREVVRVDMLVTDHGAPVTGLHPSDFQVSDNGVPQKVDLISVDELPVSVVLAAEVSGSISGDRLDQLRRAGRAMLDALKPDDRAALVGFSHSLALDAALTTDRQTVLSALGRGVPDGGTALYDACYAGLTLAASDAGRGLLIVLSDGVDTSSWLSAADVLDVAKRSAVVVYGVPIKPPPLLVASALRSGRELAPARERAESLYGAPVSETPTFLRDLSAETAGAVFDEDATQDLEPVFASIVREFRQRYVVSYSPRGVSDTGWHRLEVKIKGKSDAVVKARPGYQAGPG